MRIGMPVASPSAPPAEAVEVSRLDVAGLMRILSTGGRGGERHLVVEVDVADERDADLLRISDRRRRLGFGTVTRTTRTRPASSA
jgi:hypothetical protein